jgi:hypothetical protein
MLGKCRCDRNPDNCEIHNGGYIRIPKGSAPSREDLERIVERDRKLRIIA